MFKPGDDLRFALEAGEKVGVFQVSLMDHLDGDEAVQAGMKGLVDRRHAALTERRDDLVGTNQYHLCAMAWSLLFYRIRLCPLF